MRLGICVITIEYSCISIHAPLTGCDRKKRIIPDEVDISIHAPLTGCDVTEWEARATRDGISIHAPLTGCDKGKPTAAEHKPISIHAPLTGCDKTLLFDFAPFKLFQSTHPLRDATLYLLSVAIGDKFQSTHPLRDATIQLQDKQRLQRISIHAPLTGCDVCVRGYYKP